MVTKGNCSGCKDNVYNNNFHGVEACWNLDSAKLVSRYEISTRAPTLQCNFRSVTVPNCYRKRGWSYYTKEEFLQCPKE